MQGGLIRVVRAVVGVFACIVIAIGGVFVVVPEGQGARAVSIFDVDHEPTAREPVPLDPAQSTGDDWAFAGRRTFWGYGGIDFIGCQELLRYYAFGLLPFVVDRYEGRGGDDPFVSIWSFDYGDGDVAARRLGPLRDPRRGCPALDQWFDGDVEHIDVRQFDGFDLFAYRINTSIAAGVTDRDGRTVFIDGARIPDEEVVDLVTRAVGQLAVLDAIGVRGPVATTLPPYPQPSTMDPR